MYLFRKWEAPAYIGSESYRISTPRGGVPASAGMTMRMREMGDSGLPGIGFY